MHDLLICFWLLAFLGALPMDKGGVRFHSNKGPLGVPSSFTGYRWIIPWAECDTHSFFHDTVKNTINMTLN